MKKILAMIIICILCLSTFSVLAPHAKATSLPPVGYWKFDEGSGNVAHDSSGNGHDGTTYTTTWTSGIDGNALQFNGVDSYVEAASSPSLSGFTQLTLQAWVKVDTLSMPKGYIVAKSDGFAHPDMNDEYGLFIAGHDVNFHVSGPGGASYLTFPVAANAINEVGRWYFIAATWSGSTYAIYIDGTLASSGAANPGTTPVGFAPLTVGQIGHWSWTYFQGIIDEVKIYNYARTASDIQSDYNAVATSGLVGYWKFDEGSGTIAYDSSGSGNNGVIHYAAWVNGAVGKALQFNGADSWIEIPNSPTLTGLSQITLEAWIKEESIPSRPNGIISKCDGWAPPTNAEYFLGTVDGGRVFFETDNGVAIFSSQSAQLITQVGRWYHVAGTWSGNSYIIYVDGQQVLSGTCTPQTTRSNTLPVQIGRHGDWPWVYFQGIIDEVKIYNYARTPGEILTDYQTAAVEISVSPNYSKASLNQVVTFNGRVTDLNGNGIVNLQVGVDDPIGEWSKTTTTDTYGYFSYSTTATKAGSFLFAFYVGGSVAKTCILNVGMDVTFSSFPSLKVKNGETTPIAATLYVNGAEQLTIPLNPGETKDFIQVKVFNPEITPGIEYCPVEVGGGSVCVDNTGVATLTAGLGLQGSIYVRLDDSIFGVCGGAGGNLFYIVKGSGQICLGTDGISLRGDAGPGIIAGTLEIKVVSFNWPSMSSGAGSPVSLMLTDPMGNKVGFNKDTGLIDQIGWATYTGPQSEPQQINIPKMLPGIYEVELVGTEDGDYTFSFTVRLGQNTIYSQEYAGHINTGETLISTLTASETPGGLTIASGPPSLSTIASGSKLITLTGSNNVVIITSGNNIINCKQATSTTIIKTGAGNNIIYLGGGNNIVKETAEGNDIITTSNGNNIINIIGNGNNQITTGNGNDIIQITGNGNNIINAGDGNNIVTVSGKGNNQITTGRGNDIITAGDGNNIIKAGDGNNQVTAGKGNNQVTSGSGNDEVTLGNGNNNIQTGAGDDKITVGNGNNYINGGTGYDVCIHGTGHNTILNCEKT